MKFRGLLKRNFLEIIRDPLTIGLGIGFPAVMLLFFTLLNKSISTPLYIFDVNYLTPGIIVFGFCFLMMFSAILISKDRQTSMFARFQTLPLTAKDFILGYSIPFVFLAFIQIAITIAIAMALGLSLTWWILVLIPLTLPVAFIFIAIGLLMGLGCTETQISGIGTLLINFCTIFSGAWFDLEMMGGFIKVFCNCLPFAHTVSAGRELLTGAAFDFTHLYVILAYLVFFALFALLMFYFKLKGKRIQKTNAKRK